jgi:capsid protein
MSISLGGTPSATTNAAIYSYDTAVKLAYQGSSRLRSTVTVKTGVTGQSHSFRKFGTGVAVEHSTNELITPADYQHSKVPAVLSNWRIGDYTDLFDQAETTVDERAQLAMSNAKALGRAEDQLIIDALDAATSLAGTVDEDLGGTNTPINKEKLLRAKRYLTAQQADATQHTLIVNAIGMEGALSEVEVTSADYQTMRALAENGGTLQGKSAFGFNWVVLEDRVEGGLPVGSSNIRLCFAYDKAAVGLATGIEPTTRVDFVPERYSYLSQGVLKAGSTVIDSKGVVEVQSYEA